MKVAEGQHKEAKLDRSDVADGEGLWPGPGILSRAAQSKWCYQLSVEQGDYQIVLEMVVSK